MTLDELIQKYEGVIKAEEDRSANAKTHKYKEMYAGYAYLLRCVVKDLKHLKEENA